MARTKNVYVVEYELTGEWVRVYNNELIADEYVASINESGKLGKMRVRRATLLTADDHKRETGDK